MANIAFTLQLETPSMSIKELLKVLEILSQYIPDEYICPDHDILRFCPPNEGNLNKLPPDVREQLKQLGVHYSEEDGFYTFC